ncbi:MULTISPECIES: LamG-like jellyroll fold domain-containing protein [unclassified Streptomyces]|uniref:LamG-like jellyroll fold domain-containing protein n=1 Tax=unclassified Streptomyces TaxID=2593676 RepID=UPI00210F09F4|nr:LamG-like jellyroll fold domain-containing protein [Streptomyces sp. DvalAA-14]
MRTRTAVLTALALLTSAAVTVPAFATPSPPPAGTQPNYSSGQSAPVTGDSPADPGTPRLPDGYGPTAQQQQAMRAAAATTGATGKATVVDALTTADQQISAVPGGGFELTANAEPVRARKQGGWVPVDTRLRRAADGSWSPAAAAYGTVAFSGGGDNALVTSRYDGVTVALRWPGTLPAPTVSGSTATYASVLPSVDLVVAATSSGGFTDTLVVKSAAAARNPSLAELRLGTTVKGGRLLPTADGGLAVHDTRGRELLTAATPLMWDSNKKLPAAKKASAADRGAAAGSSDGSVPVAADPSDTAHPGLAARVAPVATSTTASALALEPDRRLLAAPSTVFPVYIDPTFNWHPYDPVAPAYDEVKQGCPGVSFYDNDGQLADGGHLGVGYNGWPEGDCHTGAEHAVYQWKLSSTLWGAHINTATVKASEVYSAACSGTYTVNLHWTGGIGSKTDWSNRPKNNSYSTTAGFARAYNPDNCPSNPSVAEGFNVLTPLKADASGHASSFTASLSEDGLESSHTDTGFSRFSDNPSLEVFYNTIPSVPSASTMAAISGADDAACDTTAPYPYMGKTLASTPPVLEAKVSDKDGDKLRATFQYWVDGSTTKATGLSDDNIASGSYAKYTLPAAFVSSLTTGKTVDWQAEVSDGEDSTVITQSPTCHFTAEPTAPNAPTVTSENNLFPNTDNGGGVGAQAGTTGVFDVATSGGTSATKFYYSVDIAPATSNPPASEVVTAAANAAKISLKPYSAGPHTLYVYAVDAAGDVSGVGSYPFLATGDPNTPCASLSACFNNTGISADTATTQADIDGSGDSLSATDLANAGWASGGKVTVDGATFTLPAFGAGQKDNLLAANQTVAYAGSGNALEFLATTTYGSQATPGAIAGDATAPYVPEGTTVSGSYCFIGTDPQGTCPAAGTITYTDGSTTPYDLTVPNWWMGGTLPAVTLPHRNDATGTHASPHGLFAFSVPTDPTRTIASVTLPDVGNHIGYDTPSLHIFGMATRNTTAGTPEANGATAAAPSGQSWTGAWASPNEGQYNFQGADFSNQTFRIALKPSLSGGTVRVKLDNALGASKLSIGHATIAVDSGSGAPSPIPAGAPGTLKFGGAQAVTIPQGGSVFSDPLPFTVTANQYLLVSYQLSNAVPYLVQHSFANTAYEYLTAVGAGDKTTDTTGTPFAQQWNGWYTDLVTNLDVTSAGTPTQALLGDGLIDAFQPGTTPVTSGSRVADAMAAAEPTTPHPYGTISEGIESNDLMTDNPQTFNSKIIGGPSVLSRIDRDLLDQPGISNVIITEGLEDLLEGNSSDDLEANGYTALVQQLQSRGITTTLASLTPCDAYAGDGATPNDPCTSDVDTNRGAVNDWMSSMPLGTPWDTVPPPVYFADFDTALAVPDAADGEEKLAAAADTGDHVNLTNAGYAAETTSILSPHDTWALDDGDGFPVATDTAPTDTPTTVNDTTGVGGNPLTLAGATTWTADATRGETLTFDGATAEADSAAPVLSTTGSYSVSAWVKPSALPARNATVAAQAATENSPFYLQYNEVGAGAPGWSFSLAKADTPSPGFWNAATTGATLNAWTHLVGTYNATTHTIRLYVNGTLTATTTGATSYASTGPFVVGRDQYDGVPTDYFPGSVSDLQAWNYTLSPDQVTALHQQIP